MSRTLVAASALLTLASAPALAADAPSQVCLLRSTQTITAPKKPDVFETELDCGQKPSADQERLAALVHNAMDTADALEVALQYGYTVSDSSWRDSYTGRQILGVYTLVAGTAGKAPVSEEELEDAALEETEDVVAPVIDEGPIEDEGSDEEAAEQAIDEAD